MESYDYCIIGGGPGGIGFLDRIIEEGNKTAVLIEGRNELLYTLSFMPTVKISSRMFQKNRQVRNSVILCLKKIPAIPWSNSEAD